MIEFLKHAFVWGVSPTAVFGIAVYAVIRKQYLLGFLASFGALFVCAYIAYLIFDRHLLAYNFVFGALLLVPALMVVVTAGVNLSRAFRAVRSIGETE